MVPYNRFNVGNLMTHKVSNYDCNHNLCNTVENLNGFSRLSHVICTHIDT